MLPPGAKEEIARVVAHVRRSWPDTKIWLRGDSGFARDDIMSRCEENHVEHMFGIARNKRLEPMIAGELAEAKTTFEATKTAARVLKELDYRTKKSWSRARRVVAKAEHLEKGANPRFIVTSLAADKIGGRELYENIYCARGEMEKEDGSREDSANGSGGHNGWKNAEVVGSEPVVALCSVPGAAPAAAMTEARHCFAINDIAAACAIDDRERDTAVAAARPSIRPA